MRKNKKPLYVILLVIFLFYVIVWSLKNNTLQVEAELVYGKVEITREPEVVKGREIAPVQPTVEVDTAEMIMEEMYWDDMEMMAICVEAEAGNQGLYGKRLVVDVILNRVDDTSGAWPNTIREVIVQRNQFSSYWDGGMEKVIEPSKETYEAVRMELENRSNSEIYYFREGTWSNYGERWKKVGDHYFSGK